MTLSVSSNTGGRISITFLNDVGDPLDISAFTIDVQILADISGSPLSIADGGLSLAVSGDDSNVLTISIPDGHGMSAGAYPVQGRYHTGDGNWLDLFKGELIVAARGGCGGWSVTCGTGDGIDGGIVAVSGPYLPLAGGTVTGDLTVNGQFKIRPADISDFSATLQAVIGAYKHGLIVDAESFVGSIFGTRNGFYATAFLSEIDSSFTGSAAYGTTFQLKTTDKNLGTLMTFDISVSALGASNVTSMIGTNIQPANSGSGVIAASYAYRAAAPINSGAGSITEHSDFYAPSGLGAAAKRYGVNVRHGGFNHFGGPVRVGNYTVATLPSAANAGAGAMIYLSDEAGGPTMAFSDGNVWRRTTDNAEVS